VLEMGEVPIMLLEVEFEETDGVRRIKKNEKGEHPIEAYGHMLIEMDREYQATHNGWPLFDYSTCKVKGENHGDPDYHETTIYSLETGVSVPVSKIIVMDKATKKPVPVGASGAIYTPKSETAFHVGQMLLHEKLKTESLKRGLQIKSEKLKEFSKLTSELEG
jgi:hypothetical protein